MVANEYRFGLLLFRRDGTTLGAAAVTPDWGPAVEWTRFYHARAGEAPFCGDGTASIQPLWDRSEGEPYIRGFRVVCEGDGSKAAASEFATAYFSDVAAQASSEFVKNGTLNTGDTYLFQAVAYPANGSGANAGGGLALAVEEQKPDVPLLDSDLGEFQRRSAVYGIVDADDMPVFIPQRVLDEAATLTRQYEGCETGGILIGRMRRDPALPEIFAEISAQIPVEHAQGSVAKLTFTAETWSAANAAIRLRGQSEVYLGYWHSHPVREWCKSRACSPERQKTCSLGSNFFSEDDRAVMRAAFPRAYSIGLVANDTAFTDLSFSLFGWREGRIHPRGFYLLEDFHA